MSVPVPTLVEFTGRPAPSAHAPLVVLGPSLGTSVSSPRSAAARALEGEHRVVGWDLPGHGASAPTTEPYTMAELAQGVLEAVDRLPSPAGIQHERSFYYASGSIGCCVGRQLLLDADRFSCARACEALGAFDVRDRPGAVRAPVPAVAHDVPVPPEAVEQLAAATGGRAAVLAGAAHLLPASAPQEVARPLAGHFASAPIPSGGARA
ncbi:alpha/beta fold hydrolase [Kocuria sabuli]|uniref:alpha/beta fold hydrolase n=1 Tax=Kocuria sabuli TaxID=3071448 RepID=UPI0034D72277